MGRKGKQRRMAVAKENHATASVSQKTNDENCNVLKPSNIQSVVNASIKANTMENIQEEYHALKKVPAGSNVEIFTSLSNVESELSDLFNAQDSYPDSTIKAVRSKFDVYVSNVEALKRMYNNLVTDTSTQQSIEEQLQQSQETIKRNESIISSKETELDQLREENFQLQSLIAHQEKKMSSLESDYQSKINHLEQQLQEASEKIESLDQALRISKAATEEAKNSVAKATDDYASIIAEKDKLSRQLEERRAAVKAGDIRNENLEKQVWSLKDNIKELQSLLKERDAVTLDLENQLSCAENKLQQTEATQKNIDALNEKIAQLEEEVQVARSDVEAREWRIEDLVAQVDDLRTALKEAESNTIAAKRKAADVSQQLTEMASQRAVDIEEELSTLRTMAEEVTALKATYAKKDMETAMLKQQLKTLQRTEKSPSNSESLNKEIHRLQKQIVQLESSLKSVEKAANAKANEDAAVIQEFERRVVEAEQRVVDAQQSKTKAVSEAKQVKAVAKDAMASLAAMKNELKEIRQRSAAQEHTHQETLSAAKRDADEAKSALQSALMEMKSMKTDAQVQEALEQQQIELRAEHLASLEEYASSYQVEIDAATEKTNELSIQLENAIAEKSQLEEKLNSAIEKADMQQQEYEREMKQLKEERSALMVVVDELQGALKATEQKWVSSKESVEKLKRELALSNSKIQATESLIDQLAAKAKLRDSMALSSSGKENAMNITMKKAVVQQEKQQGYRGAVLRNVSMNNQNNNC